MNESITKIKEMKKVELHRHMEGSISPEMFHKLVMKHNPLSIYSDFSEVNKIYDYSGFRGFLDTYGVVVDFLRDYDDFKFLATSICSQLKEDNVIYSELLFSPQPYLYKGLDLHKILITMFNVFEKAELKTTVIIDFVRDFKAQEAHETLEILIEILSKDEQLKKWVKAISIGGDELNYPAKLFKTVFKKARDSDLHVYAHAGEWDVATSVWDALNVLGVNRVGHGIRSIEDSKLIDFLKKHNIVLDISITSNYLTTSLQSGEVHPVGALFNIGVCISLNTDDPGFFHTNLNQEYLKFIEMGFTFEDLLRIRKYSIEGSFLTNKEKNDLYSLIQRGKR
jgi:adenosine deaminase